MVRTEEPDADAAARYAVVAGGRRLKALQALIEDGVLDPDHPVPCLVKPEGVELGEISLAENVVRIAMHPADQVMAFTNLAEAGLSVAAIAARFGMSERLIEQRLRLGNAAPELLDAYRADAIDLEVLKAFAVKGGLPPATLHLSHGRYPDIIRLSPRPPIRTIMSGSADHLADDTSSRTRIPREQGLKDRNGHQEI